ncbi:MAG: YIP1 family protein, partial [Bacillota bacterium]
AVVWAGALLFIGTIVTHEYSVSKAVFSIAVIVVGIVLVAFVGLLFFMIIDRLIYFVIDLYNEITYRMV